MTQIGKAIEDSTDTLSDTDGAIPTSAAVIDVIATKANVTHAATHTYNGADEISLTQSQISGLATSLAAKAPIASPAFTGTPTAPTAAANTNTTQIATTEFVTVATRELLTAVRTYYVRTDGADTNTGLVDSAGGAFLTIQRAFTVICAELDTAGYTITIQVRDGSYAAGINISTAWTGGSAIILTGNATNPENVIITANTAVNCSATLPAIFTVQNMSFIPSGAGSTLLGNNGIGTISYSNIRFGATAGRQILSGTVGSIVSCAGNYAIVGNGYSHFTATTGGSIICSAKTITITGTPAFAATFAESSHLGMMYIYNNSYSGSATGARYNATTNSDIFSAVTLPGDSAGSVATGGLYA